VKSDMTRPGGSPRIAQDLVASHRRVAKAVRRRRAVGGAQYTSLRFTQRLADAGVAPSTGSVDDSYDNAVAESFFGTLKTELLYRHSWASRHLRSSVPDGATSKLQAAAYRELLDHLGIDRVFLAGTSAGGPSAMWFAIDYPERTSGLILLSSAVPGPEPAYMPDVVAANDLIYWAAVRSSPERLLGLLVPKSIITTMTDEQKDFVVKNAFVAAMPISERSDGILFDNKVSLPRVNDIPFEQISVPTLIIQAVDDPREFQGGQEMARRIPTNRFVGLTGGHFLLTHGSEVRAAIHDFIEKFPE
jgi:pimeloyl-ACP methyl ester carboxylesterase